VEETEGVSPLSPISLNQSEIPSSTHLSGANPIPPKSCMFIQYSDEHYTFGGSVWHTPITAGGYSLHHRPTKSDGPNYRAGCQT
jgi:hypothetical protein